MISFCKKSAYLACAAAAVLALSGCSADPTPSPTTIPQTEAVQETTIPKESIEHLTLVMKAGEIYTLDYYPNLKSVDLSGSTCYDTILEYIANHPQVDVTYSVDVGGSSISNKSTSATLEAGAFDYDLLMTNLQFLPNLSTLSLPNITLTSDQVGALLETYPQVSLDYTVTLFGQALGQDVTNLDLTTMTSDQVSEACQKLGLLTHLTDVELGENLTLEDVAKLQDAAERVTFHYSFTLFGQTLSTTDETVEYKNQNIGNEGEAEIRRALPVLDNCQRFILDNCGLDNEVLAGIREDFRDGPKVVWRVYYGVDGRYNLLTDADTLRAVYNVTDETCGPMRYCEDVKYMDIGHNETLTDLSFIGYMPNIEVVIASGCAVKELVGFENCKKLTWLELAYCGKLENIDSLAGCESLTYLNLSFTKVSNFQPLDSLPLDRFVCLRPRASTEEQNNFVAIHDGCLTVFYGYSNPYGYGWRYDDNGKTFNEYYKNVVREAFNYNYLEQFLPKE